MLRFGIQFVFFLIFASLLGGGCTDTLNGSVPTDTYLLRSNLAYGNLDRQHLDIYQPKGAKPLSDVVVFFYGGYWMNGDKESYRFIGQALSSQGFVAVLPDYRLYPTVTFPAFVQDGAAAVRWVRDHIRQFGGDPKHIYLMGHSAGAYIAVLLTLDDEYLKAAGMDRSDIRATCGLAGPYDFKMNDRTTAIFNVKAATRPADLMFEPIEWVDGHAPPLLLSQGTFDTTVDPGNATRLGDRIRQNGGEVKVIMYPGQGHVGLIVAMASSFRWTASVLKDAVEFFHAHR